MTPDFTLEPWESLLGNLGQTEPDASESQSLSLDARYPPPTPKHTQALELCPRSHTHTHTCFLTDTFAHRHTKTQMCAAHPPTHTPKHSNTLTHKYLPTLTHVHVDMKRRKLSVPEPISILPCAITFLIRIGTFLVTRACNKFTRFLPPSQTYFKYIVCLSLCPRLWFLVLPISLFFTYAPYPIECRILCVCVCGRSGEEGEVFDAE